SRRLDEGERREREREYEEPPAERLDREAEYPTPAPEQPPKRGKRRPDRERRKLADGAVLQQVAHVERARGGERGGEGKRELHRCTMADALGSRATALGWSPSARSQSPWGRLQERRC